MVKVTEVRANYGISVEINGVWYRLDTGMTINPDGANTKELRGKVFQQIFNECETQLEAKINEIQS